jgi:hypothetical protein
MWESRRDFQRVWEGWEAGFMAFHAFHTLSFPWPAFSRGYASCESCTISREPQTGCFIAKSIVAERLGGLDTQSATGGNRDGKANNETERDDGHEIG